MTGSIPGFVDVALNLGSSALTEDSLVAQWLDAGRKLTLFGDDTWTKLFPDAFLRSDGVTSFFVADYTEVIAIEWHRILTVLLPSCRSRLLKCPEYNVSA